MASTHSAYRNGRNAGSDAAVPSVRTYQNGLTVGAGYSYILDAPLCDLFDVFENCRATVDVRMLGLQFLIVVAAGGALFLAFKSR